MSTKSLREVLHTLDHHWVGDGFPVRTLFAYSEQAYAITPFLLLDYAGPAQFEPTTRRRGVGEHPHRGFETVTIVYSGEVEHRDSSGGGGRIGPGDVQWMTAASGLVHEEFHGRDFARVGGRFEMVQLWVNLPAKDKRHAPGYQAILDAEIPRVELAERAGSARVIAGEFRGSKGPAHTFTPMQVLDLRLAAGARTSFDLADGWTVLLAVLEGELRAGGAQPIREAEVGVFDRAGDRIELACAAPVHALLLAGEPIHEPVVGRGPFVMNTIGEIRQAMLDYESGAMGHLA